jgi:hypothetical protein
MRVWTRNAEGAGVLGDTSTHLLISLRLNIRALIFYFSQMIIWRRRMRDQEW